MNDVRDKNDSEDHKYTENGLIKRCDPRQVVICTTTRRMSLNFNIGTVY